MKLRLLDIEPDRVATPLSMVGKLDVHDGIKVDENGKPIEYYVSKRHPGSTRGDAYTAEYFTVPARDMIHVYLKERAGQTRGYPWLGPTLEIWAQIRDYTNDTLLAALRERGINRIVLKPFRARALLDAFAALSGT